MFNSPTAWCPVIKEWVALDEGVAECARVHHCKMESCPMARLFAGEESADTMPTRASTMEAAPASERGRPHVRGCRH